MTVDYVLQAVGPLGPWNLEFDGCIRNNDGCCPLGALAVARGYRTYQRLFAFDAVWLFKLSREDARDLIRAADNAPDARLRSRLLAACGLEENQ